MSTTTNPHLTLRSRIGFGIFFFSFLLFLLATGGNFYQMVAENPNWAGGAREYLENYQRFFRRTHAGYFFQTMIPSMILCQIAALILLRNEAPGFRRRMLLIVGGSIAVEAFTFIYFLPRIMILFLNPLDAVSDEAIARAANEWQSAHILRMLMVMGIFWMYARLAWSLCVARIRATDVKAAAPAVPATRTVLVA